MGKIGKHSNESASSVEAESVVRRPFNQNFLYQGFGCDGNHYQCTSCK